jgi:hypothetical protein
MGLDKGEVTMLRYQGFLTLFGAVVLFSVLGSPPVVAAADKESPKQVVAILFEKDEKNHTWILVKADGEDAPVKYLVRDGDKKVIDVLKTVYGASRLQLTYTKDGDTRQVVSAKKQVLAKTGTVDGVVVKVHNDFWVEVKLKNGISEAYAPGANYKDKAFMDKLKSLQKGDKVTITFNTDFERHRILSLKKN